MHSAFFIAKSGRPGPVLVDIPKDIQTFTASYLGKKKKTKIISYYRPKLKPEAEKIDKVIELLQKSKKPIFYIGGGTVNSGSLASNNLFKLIKNVDFHVLKL